MNTDKHEAAFYREQLEFIAGDKRKTRAQRLAASALTFWDEMKKEAAKRSPAAIRTLPIKNRKSKIP